MCLDVNLMFYKVPAVASYAASGCNDSIDNSLVLVIVIVIVMSL